MAWKIVNEYIDQSSGFLRSGNWAVPGGNPAALQAALQGLTNSNLGASTYGISAISSTPAASAQYALTTDVMVLNFLTTTLTGVRLTVPAPAAAGFGSDGVTVNPSNPLVAAVIAAAIGFLADSGGNLVASYNTGVYASRRVDQNG